MIIMPMFIINIGICFSQNTVTLDNAIKDMAVYFTGKIQTGSKIVVLNIRFDNDRGTMPITSII
jgi:hypothetical protein